MALLAPKASPFSDASQAVRRQMWLMACIAVAMLGVAALGARGQVDPWIGMAAGGLAALALVLTGVLGLQARRQALADRELAGKREMIVTLTALLGRQDDATLERIAGTRGTQAEVARMLLDGRQGKE
ncbi:MAG TPA: hypothetical protein VLA95_01530 [Gemmatimonadales bacterium]|nr:hypothetical protein [Gemmatimonadales bacterium]